jgi:type III secretory pathway component EscU
LGVVVVVVVVGAVFACFAMARSYNMDVPNAMPVQRIVAMAAGIIVSTEAAFQAAAKSQFSVLTSLIPVPRERPKAAVAPAVAVILKALLSGVLLVCFVLSAGCVVMVVVSVIWIN